MQEETSDPVERWMAKRNAALILAILKGETSATQANRQHQLMIAEVAAWRD